MHLQGRDTILSGHSSVSIDFVKGSVLLCEKFRDSMEGEGRNHCVPSIWLPVVFFFFFSFLHRFGSRKEMEGFLRTYYLQNVVGNVSIVGHSQ